MDGLVAARQLDYSLAFLWRLAAHLLSYSLLVSLFVAARQLGWSLASVWRLAIRQLR